MNNSKLIVFLSCLAALTLTAPLITAAPRGSSGQFSGGHRFGSMPARGGQTFTRSGAGNFRTFNDRRFVGNRFVGNRFVGNRFVGNRFVFIDTFGFPFWGWGWGWGYPYGYYGYDPYGYDYYGGSAYGYGYGNQGYGYGNGSSVVELQRRLARAGYYHGAIDGIMGPATRRALREYERTHNQSGYGMTDRY
jgi:hypothetical protein